MVIRQPEVVWTVVKVESGIPVTVEAFTDQQAALNRERRLRANMRPDNDETGVFRVSVKRILE